VTDPSKYKDGADKVGVSFKKAQLLMYKNKERKVVQDDIKSLTMGRSLFIVTPDIEADFYALNVFKTGDENDKGSEFKIKVENKEEDQKLDISVVMNNSESFGFNQNSKN